MVKLAMVLSALMLATAPAHAEDRPLVFDLSEYTVVTGHALDLATTQRCLGAGRCHETNAWLARFDRPLPFTVAKFAVGGVGLWATRKLHASHPKWATALNYALGAGFTAIAIRNEQIGR